MEEKRNENLRFYSKLKVVPDEAKKEIKGGRINGMTDINPQFRIAIMTETFGPCGIGWKYEITKQWQETYGQEVKAFTNINLFIKVDGEWSEPIPGTGGSSTVEVTSKGPYVSDECYKMSLTDALSVAMKALGVAGDVYFGKGVKMFNTKYESEAQETKTTPASKPAPKTAPKAPAPALQSAEDAQLDIALMDVRKADTVKALNDVWFKWEKQFKDNKLMLDACTQRKAEIVASEKGQQ